MNIPPNQYKINEDSTKSTQHLHGNSSKSMKLQPNAYMFKEKINQIYEQSNKRKNQPNRKINNGNYTKSTNIQPNLKTIHQFQHFLRKFAKSTKIQRTFHLTHENSTKSTKIHGKLHQLHENSSKTPPNQRKLCEIPNL